MKKSGHLLGEYRSLICTDSLLASLAMPRASENQPANLGPAGADDSTSYYETTLRRSERLTLRVDIERIASVPDRSRFELDIFDSLFLSPPARPFRRKARS